MYEAIATGSVAIFTTSKRAASQCRAFVKRLGGAADKARVLGDLDAVLAALDDRSADVIVFADDGWLYDARGARVVERAAEAGVALSTVFDVALVEPDEATVAALLRGEPAPWAPLLEALMKGHLGELAPASFITAAEEHSVDVDEWTAALARAIDRGPIKSEHVTGVLGPKRKFASWFANAIAATRSGPDAYAARLQQLETHPTRDVVAQCQELRDELAAQADEDLAELHTRSCLIYTARLLEDGAWDEAAAAASDALAVARRRGDARAEAVARRLCAGAWLGQGQIARAFAELDAIFAAPRKLSKEEELLAKLFGHTDTPGPVLAAKRFFSGPDKLEEARRDVAFHAQGAPSDADEEWRDALSRLAAALAPADAAAAQLVRARLAASKPVKRRR